MSEEKGKPCVAKGCDNKTMTDFEDELRQLINKHGMENKCDMPDFIMAGMIVRFIDAVGVKIKSTLDWHGCNSVCHPKGETETETIINK